MHVLLIEDNPLDARAAARGLKAWTAPPELMHVADGDTALAHLRNESTPRPDLVLLDLNLPGRDGHDLLAIIKSDPELRRIPVIVMTTSSSDVDISASYDLGANSFVIKPSDLAGWTETLRQIERFWVHVATLPSSEEEEPNL